MPIDFKKAVVIRCGNANGTVILTEDPAHGCLKTRPGGQCFADAKPYPCDKKASEVDRGKTI